MAYLMAGQLSELERLRLESRVGNGQGRRVLEVGYGAMGWPRLLSRWVGEMGEVVGTDVDDCLLCCPCISERWGSLPRSTARASRWSRGTPT